jgi:glycine dehydrogenase
VLKYQKLKVGKLDAVDNPLKNAPHTASVVTADDWTHPYSRQTAAFPLPYVAAYKFWPSVGRVNDTHGDRTLICSCPPIESYAEEVAIVLSFKIPDTLNTLPKSRVFLFSI